MENTSPNQPSNPSPEDGAINQTLDILLSWTGGDPDGDTVTYDVYFEADDNSPDDFVSAEQMETDYDPGELNTNTVYFWQIVAKDEHGVTTTGPVWNFTTSNAPPYEPSKPFPPDDAVDQSLNVILSWIGGDPDGDVVTYDVYFEAGDNSPDNFVSAEQMETDYSPGELDANTVYFWQIVAKDEHGVTTTGPVWNFTTSNTPPYEPSNPFPPDDAVDQSLNVILSWTGGDPDGDVVTYDVYFEADDSTPDDLVSVDQLSEIYTPGDLDPASHYYWQIIAEDAYGAVTPGRVIDFYTGDYSAPPAGMVLVPEGNFAMGCDLDSTFGSCGADELPLHTVYLDVYYIDKYEVTNAQYADCVATEVCTPPNLVSSATRESYYGNSDYADYPVLYIDWEQANTFCSWNLKRLPTEAEWEKAARGNIDLRPYPWGSAKPDCIKANFLFGGSLVYCVGDTSQVGIYPDGASPYGAFDMSGNILEWVYDWYQSDYYSTSPDTNPMGPITGTIKVMRGGSWNLGSEGLQVFSRDGDYPVYQGNSVGFRCVLDVIP